MSEEIKTPKKSKKDILIFNLKQEIKELKAMCKEYEKDLIWTFEILENNNTNKNGNVMFGFVDMRYKHYEQQQKLKAKHDKEQASLPPTERKPFVQEEFVGKPYCWNLEVFNCGKGRKVYRRTKKGEKIRNHSHIYLLHIYTDSNEDIPIGSLLRIYKPIGIRKNYETYKICKKCGNKVTHFANDFYYKCNGEAIIEFGEKQRIVKVVDVHIEEIEIEVEKTITQNITTYTKNERFKK